MNAWEKTPVALLVGRTQVRDTHRAYRNET